MEYNCEYANGAGPTLGPKNILCSCPICMGRISILFYCYDCGIMYFIKGDEHWDIVGLAAAEIGTLFISLVLITGPIWATPIWGQPWIWEPRLTTT